MTNNTTVSGMPGKKVFVVAAFMSALSEAFQSEVNRVNAIENEQDRYKAMRPLIYGCRPHSTVQGVHYPEKTLQLLQRCVTAGPKEDMFIVDNDIEVYTFQLALPYRDKAFTSHMLLSDFVESSAVNRANVGIALACCQETGKSYLRLQAPDVDVQPTDRITVLMRGTEFIGWYAGRYLRDYTAQNINELIDKNGQLDLGLLPIQVGMHFEQLGRAARRHKGNNRRGPNQRRHQARDGMSSVGAAFDAAQQATGEQQSSDNNEPADNTASAPEAPAAAEAVATS